MVMMMMMMIIIIIIKCVLISKTEVIPEITGVSGTISKTFRNCLRTYMECTSRNYGKQPYWALRT